MLLIVSTTGFFLRGISTTGLHAYFSTSDVLVLICCCKIIIIVLWNCTLLWLSDKVKCHFMVLCLYDYQFSVIMPILEVYMNFKWVFMILFLYVCCYISASVQNTYSRLVSQGLFPLICICDSNCADFFQRIAAMCCYSSRRLQTCSRISKILPPNMHLHPMITNQP